ncbi:hypothetical protein Tco_0426400, partial [Tanacetum coccineum]
EDYLVERIMRLIKNYSNSHLSKKKETMEKQTNHKKEEDVTDKIPEAIEVYGPKK